LTKNVANNHPISKVGKTGLPQPDSVLCSSVTIESQHHIDKNARIHYFDKVVLYHNQKSVNTMKALPKKQSKKRPAKKADIWIVEDNAFFKECLVELINSEKDLVCSHSFDSCEKTLQQMEVSKHPSIMLLDIGLPGMSGLEGIQKFKLVAPSTQIIIITVHEDNDSIFQAICTGAAGYLLKSSPGEKIIEAIHDVQKGGSPINVQIARKVLTTFAALNSPPPNYDLTNREREILVHMVNGSTKKEIGNILSLSHHTIDTYIRRIYEKLHVNKRSTAVAKALKQRII
jgi:DNA-binding NarL/FixJ family response regulator